jgi:hypothetical protein
MADYEAEARTWLKSAEEIPTGDLDAKLNALVGIGWALLAIADGIGYSRGSLDDIAAMLKSIDRAP